MTESKSALTCQDVIAALSELSHCVEGKLLFEKLGESVPAPGQPCNEPFTTTGHGEGKDRDDSLDAAYTEAAFAAATICARNKDCKGAQFVKYIKVGYGGVKGKVTCDIEAQFKCV